MRSSIGLLAIMLLAAAIGVVAAHSQSSTVAAVSVPVTPTPLPPTPPRTVYILGTASGEMYLPASISVRVGQAVTWVNRDTSDHTATADNGAFNSDVLAPGQRFEWKPRKSGTYPYSDFIQSNAHGTVKVLPR